QFVVKQIGFSRTTSQDVLVAQRTVGHTQLEEIYIWRYGLEERFFGDRIAKGCRWKKSKSIFLRKTGRTAISTAYLYEIFLLIIVVQPAESSTGSPVVHFITRDHTAKGSRDGRIIVHNWRRTGSRQPRSEGFLLLKAKHDIEKMIIHLLFVRCHRIQ